MPLTLAASAAFRPLDWTVLGGYFVLLLGSGLWAARQRPRGAEEYFVGDRRMPVWAVALSVLATTLSAATFIGAPVESYTGNLTYLSTSLGGLIAVAVIARFFIPVFYRERVTTVYGLLGGRFGPGAKLAASWTFMIGRVFASGSRVYMAAIPLTMILYGDLDAEPRHLLAAIAVLCTAAVLYAIVGGIRSIIWADVVQTAVFLGAAAAALGVLIWKMPIPLAGVVHALASTDTPAGGSKLRLLDLATAPTRPYTLWTALTGFALLGIASYGTDQDMVQRMLTCRTAAQGGRSAVAAILVGVPVVALFLAIGLLLYVFNLRPDIMGAAGPAYPIARDEQVFPQFILQQMPPGLSGLFMAGLFAVALTSLMSALNAMSSALVTDFYRQVRPERTEQHYLAAGRLGVAGWGVILGLFASACVYWQRASGQTLINFALGVMGFAYSGLLGVYSTALFTTRGTTASVVAALGVGFASILAMQPFVLDLFPVTAGLRLAFPWQLCIGATLSFITCVIPSRPVPPIFHSPPPIPNP